jgi:hypothetical protein
LIKKQICVTRPQCVNFVGGGMFCIFYFLMFVVFMYGLCLQVSDWLFFGGGSVNWDGLYMAVLHYPDGK